MSYTALTTFFADAPSVPTPHTPLPAVIVLAEVHEVGKNVRVYLHKNGVRRAIAITGAQEIQYLQYIPRSETPYPWRSALPHSEQYLRVLSSVSHIHPRPSMPLWKLRMTEIISVRTLYRATINSVHTSVHRKKKEIKMNKKKVTIEGGLVRLLL